MSITNDSGSDITGNISYSGAATNGIDYVTAPTTFSIAEGSSSTSITLKVIEDAIVENREQVRAYISSPSKGRITNPSYADAYIDNDDYYQIFLKKIIDGAENNGSETTNALSSIIVMPTNTSGSPITGNINYSGMATNSTDYATGPGNFSIAHGKSTAVIDLNVIEDNLLEGTETIITTLKAIPFLSKKLQTA